MQLLKTCFICYESTKINEVVVYTLLIASEMTEYRVNHAICWIGVESREIAAACSWCYWFSNPQHSLDAWMKGWRRVIREFLTSDLSKATRYAYIICNTQLHGQNVKRIENVFVPLISFISLLNYLSISLLKFSFSISLFGLLPLSCNLS